VIGLFAVEGDINSEPLFFQALAKRANKRFVIFDKKQAHASFSRIGRRDRREQFAIIFLTRLR
jgi:hypothetical protein